MRKLIAVALLALTGCATSAPETQYTQCTNEWYKGCMKYAQEELREEIQAGFYDLGDITQHCRTHSRKQCPAILKELPPR